MNAASARLWLRWSWRDLRRRWLLVSALALVIALGTGAYAGLGGTTAWRLRSNDASYAALHMHDLRVRLPEGAFARTGTLAAAARGIPDAQSIAALQERLIVATQVNASTAGRTILVPGEVVGMPADAPVDSLYLARGENPSARTAVLEAKFADDQGLPARGQVIMSGGRTVSYAGTGYTPEYFAIMGRTGQFIGDTSFAVLFMPLSAAQQQTGHAGTVNDLVVRLVPGADRDRIQSELTTAMAGLGAEVTNRDDDAVYRGLYADARNDAQTWNTFALLILLGAAVAAFNLVTRTIDAQRRELGVGMALGVSPRALVWRPLLVGAQVAIGGVVLGVGIGWLVSLAMSAEFKRLLPLPIWLTPFQTGRFLQAAALGLLIPIVATLLPLRRVLRLQPVDAIRTGAYGAAAQGGRASSLVRRVRLPGRSYASMPLRNVLRAPRRTALTAVGVAAAVTSLVAVLGLLDSFFAVGDRSTAELERASPDRLTVSLDRFYPQDAPQVRAIAGVAGVGAVEPELRLQTSVSAHGHSVDAITDVLDLRNGLWAPTVRGAGPGGGAEGLILSEKAAADLHVRPGDTVELTHPLRTTTGFRLGRTPIVVSGLHPNPLRPVTYLDASKAGLFALAGATNVLTVAPGPATSQDALSLALFGEPAVAAIRPASRLADVIGDELDQFTGILRVIEVIALLLALLIAFNSASLSADERAREQATMFAFGLPSRTVMAMSVAENAVIGLAGTLAGIGLGYLALRWILTGFAEVMPELQISATLSTGTVLGTLALGVLVVALAPLLNGRKLRRMDVPATLRVVE